MFRASPLQLFDSDIANEMLVEETNGQTNDAKAEEENVEEEFEERKKVGEERAEEQRRDEVEGEKDEEGEKNEEEGRLRIVGEEDEERLLKLDESPEEGRSTQGAPSLAGSDGADSGPYCLHLLVHLLK